MGSDCLHQIGLQHALLGYMRQACNVNAVGLSVCHLQTSGGRWAQGDPQVHKEHMSLAESLASATITLMYNMHRQADAALISLGCLTGRILRHRRAWHTH